MTTTSRRPPTRAPKKRAADRLDGAAVPAAPAPAKGSRAGASPRNPSNGGAAGAAAAKPAPAGATAVKTRTKTAPAKSTKAAKTKVAKSADVARSTSTAASRRSGQAAPRAPFVLLIVGLLGGALVSLLLLNTVLAKDAFTLTRLQQSNKQLEQQRQAYEEEIAREGSPQQLSNKAEGLGMKQGENPAFFSTEPGGPGGTIRPVPQAAAASAGAAGVLGVPGTVVPGDGAAPPKTTGTRNGHGTRAGNGTRTGNGARTGHGAP
ncbi:hypothetical protein [Actinomadura sp. K4S16]|uniref:hypothetical protein n=1 Tax=Actinomadura sp. K4S16 TaxID=1316147 RepID=UPI0011EE6920|nr:hypothetical protein [Actinomadura sp. K4S16]